MQNQSGRRLRSIYAGQPPEAMSDMFVQNAARQRDKARPGGTFHLATRMLDAAVAAALLTVCLPLFAMTAMAVAIDVGGSPIRWQRRINGKGRAIKLYSFRTLRPTFDAQGRSIAQQHRASPVGLCVRSLGLTHAPSLFNLLTGDVRLSELANLTAE